jgi:hypothetical protein
MARRRYANYDLISRAFLVLMAADVDWHWSRFDDDTHRDTNVALTTRLFSFWGVERPGTNSEDIAQRVTRGRSCSGGLCVTSAKASPHTR